MSTMDSHITVRQGEIEKPRRSCRKEDVLHAPSRSGKNTSSACEISSNKRAEHINQTLFRISNAVNTSKDLDELYTSLHHILGEVIDLTNFFIGIYHKKARRVSFPYFVDQYDHGYVYEDQINEKNSLTGELLAKQQPLFLKRAELLQRVAENRLIGTAPHVWLGIPLKIKGEVIGLIATQCYDDQDRFDQIDLDILNSVSEQIALAIERKRNEQALVASERKYRNIIDSIEDGYYEIDLNGRLVLINQAMSQLLGHGEEDLLGKKFTLFMKGQSGVDMDESLASVRATARPGSNLELELIHQSGDTRIIETVVSIISGDDGAPQGFRGIARDITERKNEERSRKLLEEQLQQSQRLESLGTLAGGVAHDFNNLLMAIQGKTELMLNGIDETHPHHQPLTTVQEYLANATSLTARLLGFARGGKYEVKPVELNELIKKSIQMFGRTKKEISINTLFKKDGLAIEADSNQIEQVLLNLLVNAGQAMPGGGEISITATRVVVDEEQSRFHDIKPGVYAEVTVADSGSGMDESTMAKIFDPFFTTKPVGYGTGLGLAMVYGIVRNHNGAISVDSTPNEGSRFTMLLPASSEQVTVAREDARATVKGSEVVLLVDDEPMITEVGRELLSTLGYDVMIASSGHEAIDMYSRNQDDIDLVIIDMIMPRMGGGELFDKLVEMNPAVRVLLASGYSLEGNAREILERGCRGFIQKPFTLAQLSEKIRKILA